MQQHATGEITGLYAHGNGTHTVVNVAHGAKPKGKAGKGMLGGQPYDNRPASTLHVPNARAAGMSIGQKVRVAVSPVGDDADDTPAPKSGILRSKSKKQPWGA